MTVSPETCRNAFRDFLDRWNLRLETLDADAQANNVDVIIDDQTMPARNLCFWLRNDDEPLPETYCNFLSLRNGTTYGQAVRKLKDELVDRGRQVYIVKLENPTFPHQPYALASTTTQFAVEEAKALFEPDGVEAAVFCKGEIATIWRSNNKIAEIRHDHAGNPLVILPGVSGDA